ncbi:MAG: 5-formyltetrahydrofolate cyclo-ligase [Pseudomonadota bacterium]
MDQAIKKTELRKTLRAARKAHVSAQPDSIRALLFNTPPRPLQASLAKEAVIGLYHAIPDEAPAASYARFFREAGYTIALPRFAEEESDMEFAEFSDPFAETDLEVGPFGLKQPGLDAAVLTPDALFIPLLGFTASGQRLGQGGGHYDRWLAEHPASQKIGLAWDIQLIEPEDALPVEAHDVALDAVITPTRMYGNL